MIPVIDGHNDLAWARREHYDLSTTGLEGIVPDLHTDAIRLRAGGVGGQFWSVWVDPVHEGAAQVTATLEQIDFVHRLVHDHPDVFTFTRTAHEARTAMRHDRIASLIGVEGGAQIDGSLGVLRQYARLGARYMTLTWNHTTDWADAATDAPRHDGLSTFGRAVVREMNRIGMLVDLAHVSPATMRDAIETSTRPVMVSHSGAAALCDHPRNVPDDVLAAIGAMGGIVMVAFVPTFLSQARRDWSLAGEEGEPPAVTVADVADHIEHIRAIAGVHAVGLGADYDGTDAMPAGLGDVSGYPRLLDELRRRGWSDDDLQGLAWRNVLRVLEASDADHLAFLSGQEDRPRVLVIVNADSSGPRRLLRWLDAEGVRTDVRHGAHGLPDDLDAYDGLVMLGGGMMPDDDEKGPWLPHERKLASEAIERDLPTLGICLGGQLLAQIAGGEVRESYGAKERGSTSIATTDEGGRDAVMSALGAASPMIENHQDQITALPPGAVLLASSDAVTVQAFRIGAHVRGVQFHPEVSADDLQWWQEPTDPAPGDRPLAEIVADAHRDDAENTAASRMLVSGFAREVRESAERRR
ncbi:membrane dipeptidase [Microbacterium sp.]|uniref:membrane dipeptidase n=1 Tax=Microbacterium sp. TaxID=51671 RepID=UPI002810EDE0|nr:membrane dipeptidase [Microbacterium sp.]